MQRTNVYLSEEQLQLLKHLAAEDRQSVATLVREAVDTYLTERLARDQAWDQRLTELVERVRRRVPASTSPEEIEADITAARQDARAVHVQLERLRKVLDQVLERSGISEDELSEALDLNRPGPVADDGQERERI